LGSAAGGGTGLAGLVKPIIALHALGRMQAARPLQPVCATCSLETGLADRGMSGESRIDFRNCVSMEVG
jgi:hypothetical protein